MKIRWIGCGLLFLSITFVAGGLLACGDKFLVAGRGTRYQRPKNARAASVLDLEEASLDDLKASEPAPARSAAERARPAAPTEKKDGPFWRRWFGD